MGAWCAPVGVGDWWWMVALWALVLAVVVWVVCRLFPSQHTPTARELLDRRLATGDVDPTIYRTLREELDGLSPVRTGKTR